MDISRHKLLKQCHDLCLSIEACGSSPELTEAVTKASSLMLQIDSLVWHTIETAPKDDTAILVALPDSNIVQSARFRNGGWVICWDLHVLSEFYQPSHWMPMPDLPKKPFRFDKTYCSQCGKTFGPGNHGFSHCENHKSMEGKS